MAWDRYSELFVTRGGRSSANVPRSCIESAEYIIQSIAEGRRLEWRSGETREPHVIAHFKDVTIDITATPDFHRSRDVAGVEDYRFAALPEIGQGLICVNKTGDELGYNMHLGAVVARDDDRALISNMMEEVGIAVMMVILHTIEIGSPYEFRSRNFSGIDDKYALGLLTPA